jgi:hypothetical protein
MRTCEAELVSADLEANLIDAVARSKSPICFGRRSAHSSFIFRLSTKNKMPSFYIAVRAFFLCVGKLFTKNVSTRKLPLIRRVYLKPNQDTAARTCRPTRSTAC